MANSVLGQTKTVSSYPGVNSPNRPLHPQNPARRRLWVVLVVVRLLVGVVGWFLLRLGRPGLLVMFLGVGV